MKNWRSLIPVIVLLAFAARCPAEDSKEPHKPRIAFFPLGGDAKEELRDKVGFSLRAKLDRTGEYEVIDGPKMIEIAAEAKEPVTFSTGEAEVKELGKLAEAQVLVWGELVNVGTTATVKLKILDLREKAPKAREISKPIAAATDLRFVSEQILESLPGVRQFEHPSETAVTDDEQARELWKKGPDLMTNGDFSKPGKWNAIYQAEKYEVQVSDAKPAVDKVNIFKLAEGGKTNNVLAMNLSRVCAENNGMACLSERIEIAPNQRYRLSFRYKSDGPTLHVFVKGYVLEKNIKGEKVEREIYRRQVPPTGATNGKWVTVVDDMNPQHVAFPVQYLRVDLYAYLSPGEVMFDDVVVKAVGKQTHKAKDEAFAKPASRPAGAK